MIISAANRLDNINEYYFSKKLAQIAEMRKMGLPIINLGIGSPDLPPSPASIEALYQSALKEQNHGYQSYRGIPELRTAIADWYKETYGVQLNPTDEILPMIGSKEANMHLAMSFLNSGDEVLVPNPGYPTYPAVVQIAGGVLRWFNLDENKNWEVDIDALEKSDLSKVKMMWINYPNMPTGANASDELYRRLIKLAKQKQFLLVNDNPYSLILNPNPKSILSYEGAWDVCVELNSFSKSHNMPGWRLGYMIGKKDYVDTVLKFKSNMDSGMFLPIQHAAIEALKNTKEWHHNQNEEYAKRRNFAYQIYDLLHCKYDKNQVGMFIWAKVPDYVASAEQMIEDLLQKAHVFITPGLIFGSNGNRYLRISLCSKPEVYQEALQRVQSYLKQHSI